MSELRYAVFVDLENAGGKVATLQNIIEKVKIRGNILIGKVYGYSEHYADLKPVLLSNTFSVVPSIRYGGRQKNNMDIQLVIDALDIAFTNQLIDCFCIVSGDSDYTPLVGKLKSMGKFVLGISRSECASEIFIHACNEFVFLEAVQGAARKKIVKGGSENGQAQMTELLTDIERVLTEQAGAEGFMYASEMKSAILRLRADFAEKAYGAPSFGKLLAQIESKTGLIKLVDRNNNLLVRLTSDDRTAETAAVNRENFLEIIGTTLGRIREDGFERVNPSIIKDSLTREYPTFDERVLGFKKFSDLLKRLEKEKLVVIEWDEDKNLLVRIAQEPSQ